jgi:hypothetical protein
MSQTFSTHLSYSASHAHHQDLRRRAEQSRRIRISRRRSR